MLRWIESSGSNLAPSPSDLEDKLCGYFSIMLIKRLAICITIIRLVTEDILFPKCDWQSEL